MNLKRKARNLKKMMDVGGYDYYKQARKLQKELGIKEKTAFLVRNKSERNRKRAF